MIQGCQNFRFTLEAAHAVGIAGEFIGQDLDRDIPFQVGIARPVDLSCEPILVPIFNMISEAYFFTIFLIIFDPEKSAM